MKKLLALVFALSMLGACSGMNKNTVSYRLSKTEGEKYLTALGTGESKAEAEKNARAEMKRLLTNNPVGDTPLVADLYNQAVIKEAWTDKKEKKYYAIAAVDRNNAQKLLVSKIQGLDGQIDGAAKKLENTDKFAVIKAALKIQPLLQERNAYEDLYSSIDYNGQGYNTAKYDNLKNIVYQSMSKVKISLNSTDKTEVLYTHLINALNEMGLDIAINQQDADIAVEASSKITEYPSTKVNGLMWCSATSSVSLKDMETQAVFSRFSVSDRTGSSRGEEAERRTLDSIGQTSAKEIKQRLYAYLERR